MILKSFKRLLGNGRAWVLRAPNIKNTVKAFLPPLYDVQNMFYRVAMTPFPTQNTYADDITADLKMFENQFGIDNPPTTTQDRAQFVEAQWGMVGAQGWGYIESVLQKAGLSVTVVENLPIAEVIGTGLTQYGQLQYGQNQYGAGGYKVIGNGLLNIGGVKVDPVVVTSNESVFVVYSETILTNQQYQVLEDLILRIKSLNTVCILREG